MGTFNALNECQITIKYLNLIKLFSPGWLYYMNSSFRLRNITFKDLFFDQPESDEKENSKKMDWPPLVTNPSDIVGPDGSCIAKFPVLISMNVPLTTSISLPSVTNWFLLFEWFCCWCCFRWSWSTTRDEQSSLESLSDFNAAESVRDLNEPCKEKNTNEKLTTNVNTEKFGGRDSYSL